MPLTNTADPNQNPDENRSQNRGTGFTNINKILDANQGAGEKIGQAIGTNLAGQADSVRAGIQAGQQQFNTQKTEAGQQAKDVIQAGTQTANNVYSQAGATAAPTSQDTTDYTKIGQDLSNAQYTGPMALQNAGQIQAQSANATALGRLAGSSGGQTQLLQNIVAKPGQYTRGQSALDSLLLGQQGQGAIQQGRQATLGVQQQATGATTQAEAQANALKSGIDTSKTNALNAIQNQLSGAGDATSGNVVGLQQQAKNQAASFNKDAGRMQQLLEGKNADGSPITALSADDKRILDNMNKYGIQNQDFYTGDQQARDIALNTLGQTLATDAGGSQYQGNQQQAAQNLAALLGQSDIGTAIKNQQFNTNVFSKDQNVLQSQATAKANALAGISDIGNKVQTLSGILASPTGTLDVNKLTQFADSPLNPLNPGEDQKKRDLAIQGALNGPLGNQILDQLTPAQREYIDQQTGGWNKDTGQWIRLARMNLYKNLNEQAAQQAAMGNTYNSGTKDLRSAILQRLGQQDYNTPTTPTT